MKVYTDRSILLETGVKLLILLLLLLLLSLLLMIKESKKGLY